MGLDVYLVKGKPTDEYDREQYVEIASAKHPEHYWKIGYHRSSYNGGGFNTVAKRYGLPDLYAVYAVGNDDYEVTPDWAAVKERAVAAIAQVDATRAEFGGLSFQSFNHSIAEDQATEADFVKAAAKRLADGRKSDNKRGSLDGGWWSGRDGSFTAKEAEALKVVGVKVVNGRFGPEAWLACLPDKADDTFDHLRSCYEIIVETCDFALAATEPLHMRWSG